jgi:hypothetical protein
MKKGFTALSAFVLFILVGYMTLESASGSDRHHGHSDLWTARMIQNALSSMQKSINELVKAVNKKPSNGTTTVAPPPAWSQVLPAAERFQAVLNGAAVLDNETRLVWERSPVVGLQDWTNADASCVQKTVGNRKGWRLPTAAELASLVEPSLVNPSLPSGHPFSNVQLFGYWTASAVAFNVSFGAVVDFSDGHVGFVDKDDSRFVWCVRGGA